MAIKVTQFDGAGERLIASAAATNAVFLARFAPLWEPHGLPSPWASLVVDWCVTYHRQYDKPPGLNLEALFEEWKESSGADLSHADLAAKFLQTLSSEYRKLKEGVDHNYCLELAAKLMTRTRMRKAADAVGAALESGDDDRAVQALHSYRPVEVGKAGWIDLGNTDELTRKMTLSRERRGRPLVEYDGALGNFFGRAMERGNFVAFLGYKKGTKSWYLHDAAWRAVSAGHKVAYFEAGDLTEAELLDRLASRAAGRPLYGDRVSRVELPVSMEPPEQGTGGKKDGQRNVRPVIETSRKWFKEDLSVDDAVAALSQFGPDKIRVSAHPNSTLSVAGAEGYLERWKSETGWEPDVIVMDYPDIMVPNDKRTLGLDRINNVWKELRGLSQKKDALVLVATQARRDSHYKWLMGQDDVADDIRKVAHATGVVGINRDKWDIDHGAYRLNWVAVRGLAFPSHDYVYCAGNLSVGSPTLVSIFPTA